MERVIDSRKKSIPDRVGPSEPKSPCPARKYSSSPSARGRNRQRERKKVIASSRINARAVGDQFEFPTPRLSYREKAASPPRLPRVGARGGPVCRGQVRGSCPPGATLPTTGGSRCRDARGGDSADVIGRWLARGSAILWRSVDEQSVVPDRSRGTQEFNDYVLLITLLVFVSRGLSNRSPLEVNNNQNLFYLFHKPIYDKHMYWVCVERNQAFLSFLPIFYSIFPIIFLRICTWSYCSIWTQSATVRHSVLYVQSVRNQPVLKFGPRVHLGPVVSFVSIPSCPPPPPPPDPHGCSRHLESTTATFMGASCAVKGSKSHPCHCCSHLASPGASVQQQQHHHHRHHHHHHETHHAHHQHHHHHHPAGKQPSAELQPQNNNGDCNILAPLRSKMKVLKKLKRKMGLGEPHPPLFSSLVFFFFFFFFFSFFFPPFSTRSLRSQPDLTCGHFSRVCGC